MSEHTKTPWKLSPPNPARFPAHHIQSETGAYIADVEIRSQNPAGANAAFIVRACNSHEALKEFAEWVLQVEPENSLLALNARHALKGIA